MLFEKSICGWEDWGRLYRSIPDFLPLAQEIFVREKLPPIRGTAALTPGTNAVFRADEFVVKIFAPAESGVDAAKDFQTELDAMQQAEMLGIAVPKLRAAGFVDDRYRFYYLVSDYVSGEEAGSWLLHADKAAQMRFCGWLREETEKLHQSCPAQFRQKGVKQALVNPKWKILPPKAEAEREILLAQLPENPLVFVHGDLTAENLLVDSSGQAVMIDFADAVLAPEEYELPPILFSLLNYSPVLAAEFWKGRTDSLAEAAFRGILLHEYGAWILREVCERFQLPSVEELGSLELVREALHQLYS